MGLLFSRIIDPLMMCCFDWFNKKAQDLYSLLILLLKAFALPENAERAM